VLLFNTTGSLPLGIAPLKNVTAFYGYPSPLVDTVNGKPPIVYRSPVDLREHASLLGRDINLYDIQPGGLGMPGWAVSADKWTIRGAEVIDLTTGIVASYATPEHFVCPATIGLDGFWYTVDLGGRLYAVDVPALPEGPLPPEEP